MSLPNPREYLSVLKTVKFTGLKKSAVYKAINAQDFPAVADVTTGRPRYKIPTFFLMEWLEERITKLTTEMEKRWNDDQAKIKELKRKKEELKEYRNGR